MPKISVVILSEFHTDDAPLIFTREKRNLLKQCNIPVGVGVEKPMDDEDIKEMTENYSSWVKTTETLIKYEKICNNNNRYDLILEESAKLTRKEYEYRKLTFANKKACCDLIIDICNDQNPKNPFCYLDQPLKEREQFSQEEIAAEKEACIYVKWSFIRVKQMVKNILPMLLSFKETGGVVLISPLGQMHAHRLAAFLAQALKELHLSDNLSFEIITTKAWRKSDDPFQIAMQELDEAAIKKESPETLEYYRNHHCYELHYTPIEPGVYQCKELDQIFDRIIIEQLINRNRVGQSLSIPTPTITDIIRSESLIPENYIKSLSVTDNASQLSLTPLVVPIFNALLQGNKKLLSHKDKYISCATKLLGEQFQARYASIPSEKLWVLNESESSNKTLTLSFIKLREDGTKQWFEMILKPVAEFVKFIPAGKDVKGNFYHLQFQKIDKLAGNQEQLKPTF